jgi:hypothetical protein
MILAYLTLGFIVSFVMFLTAGDWYVLVPIFFDNHLNYVNKFNVDKLIYLIICLIHLIILIVILLLMKGKKK